MGAAGRIFEVDSSQAAPLLRLSACLGSNTSVRKCAGSGADVWSTLSGEGDAGRYDFGGSCWNILRGGKRVLSGAQGLFER